MKFEITRYYSTFITIQIEADSEDEAYEKSNSIPINENEILTNIEDWVEADEITRVEDLSSKM
ncbi:MAG: hypothetical protein IIC75_03225 [Bacteroidetes bacterium]|nr:hypothetical protein [Bacteroidota bacterium]